MFRIILITVLFHILLPYSIIGEYNDKTWTDCSYRNLTSLDDCKKKLYTSGLNLSGNSLEKADFATYYTYLEKIDLSYNGIRSLAKFSFIGFPKLSLYLNDNFLKTFSDSKGLGDIYFFLLDLTNNRIENIKDILGYIKAPFGLFLSGNNIKTISQNDFNGKYTMSDDLLLLTTYAHMSLDLSKNYIDIIESNTFKEKKIFHLDLSFNNIKKVSQNAFSGCKISIIDLSFNKITNIDVNAFYKSKVHSIDLRFNSLEQLPDGVFSSLQTLTDLNLKNNNFKKLGPNFFTGLISLTSLDLSNNQIRNLELLDLFHLMELKHLNLRNNSLSNLNVGNLLTQHKKLELIDISANFWDCKTLTNMLLTLTKNGVTYVNGNQFKVRNVHGIPCLAVKVPFSKDMSYEEFLKLIAQETDDMGISQDKSNAEKQENMSKLSAVYDNSESEQKSDEVLSKIHSKLIIVLIICIVVFIRYAVKDGRKFWIFYKKRENYDRVQGNIEL